MKAVFYVVAVFALAAVGFVAAGGLARPASAHLSGCHSHHTCPSDHHTYVWVDPATGLGWDCAEPGAKEYDPSRDATVIGYDGYTYYCRSSGGATTTETTTTASTTTTTTTAPTSTAATTTAPTAELILPESTLTPGVFNPAVSQATIRRTICVSGWTRRIRPPASYTNALKLQQMQQYGEGGTPADYEEDHLIPLELGGAPRSPQNLWPEPRLQSRDSDPLETALKRKVCRGAETLAQARGTIRDFKYAHG